MTGPAFLLLATYLLAALPFGYLLGRAGGIDVRQVGSGNIGATNVLRARGAWAGGATLLLDGAKGAAGILAARAWFPEHPWLPIAAAVVAVTGHCYPVYLGFRGGKGVATAAGASLALVPLAALLSLAAFAAVVLWSRRVSLASLAGALTFPLFAWTLGRPDASVGGMAVGLLIVWRHRENIVRLARGSEPRVERSSRSREVK